MTKKKTTKIIVSAALEYEGVIVVGRRHFDMQMLKAIKHLRFLDVVPTDVDLNWKQGFIDQYGNFYDRKEAYEIAVAAIQPIDAKGNGYRKDMLFSEGIY